MLVNESSQTPDPSGERPDPLSVQVIENCEQCGSPMDMSEVMPFAEVNCPSCGAALRARKHFNNFTLLQLIGEGGMGSVYKALDVTLNRHVALKILKKECSANEEEREKLAQEARLTAAINHPHVVKVFDFGQDHGQFYLAMEFVEKGSLDDLMGLQKRVAEAQVLKVGMQIAQGLEAALEIGLIHRDIKPGNILFADAHTAKLVDFGLAIVMDEEAHSRGEIWGTPYYIAPEKLDDQPEDFRSDMYSLGGTLFHALAGRPPYEAESASMVALKQLKSQPVSLEAFAPDVSSETAYVINRMMAKNPDDRYASYAELVGHLSYAREKLLERARKPIQPKEREVVETAQTRKLSAYLSIGLLAAVVLTILLIFVFRDSIFPSGKADGSSQVMAAGDAQSLLLGGVSMLAGGDYEKARGTFQHLASNETTPQPQKNWAFLNAALASLLIGDKEAAMESLNTVKQAGLYSTDPKNAKLANFFVEASRVTAQGKSIPNSIRNLYTGREEAFALLLFAVWDWEGKSEFASAGQLFSAFLNAKPSDEWIQQYHPLAEKYVRDWKLLEPIEAALASTATPEAASALLVQVNAAKAGVRTGSTIAGRLDVIQKRLELMGAKP